MTSLVWWQKHNFFWWENLKCYNSLAGSHWKNPQGAWVLSWLWSYYQCKIHSLGFCPFTSSGQSTQENTVTKWEINYHAVNAHGWNKHFHSGVQPTLEPWGGGGGGRKGAHGQTLGCHGSVAALGSLFLIGSLCVAALLFSASGLLFVCLAYCCVNQSNEILRELLHGPVVRLVWAR